MNIFCIGRNYVDHINELKNETPTEPIIFIKPGSALHQKSHPFTIPNFSSNFHYEVELVLKISKNIPIASSHLDVKNCCDSITVGLDVTARDVQDKLKEKGLPWEKAKAFDNSAFVGKFYPLANYVNKDISFSLYKNHQLVQKGNSSFMIYNFNNILNCLSIYFTLNVGDLVFTGTPAGVGKINNGDFFEGYLNDISVFECSVY